MNIQKGGRGRTDKFMLLAILTTNIMFIYIKIYVCIVRHHLPLAFDGKTRREKFNVAFCFADKLQVKSISIVFWLDKVWGEWTNDLTEISSANLFAYFFSSILQPYF